jgi:hypothetical protein
MHISIHTTIYLRSPPSLAFELRFQRRQLRLHLCLRCLRPRSVLHHPLDLRKDLLWEILVWSV